METTERKVVRSSVQLVSPQLAEQWLTHNTKNRVLREGRVDEILGWMKSGKWEVTTDAIGFDTDGVLNNGQHRLAALIKYGKPLEMLVAKNLSTDAFKVIDTNKLRSAADILGIAGFNYSTSKAGIVKFVLGYKKGSTNKMIAGGLRRLTNTQIEEYALNNKEKLNAAGEVAKRTASKFRGGLEARYVGGLFWIFAEKDKIAAELFFQYFGEGTGLTPNDPILILRNKFIQNMSSMRKMSGPEKIANTIIAWNNFRSGKKVRSIRWANTETLPKPI